MWERTDSANVLVRCCLASLMIFLITLPVLLGWEAGLIQEIGTNPSIGFLLAGSILVLGAARPSRQEWIVLLALTVLSRVLYDRTQPAHATGFAAGYIYWGAFGGLAALIVLALRVARTRGVERKLHTERLGVAAILPYTWLFASGFAIPLITLLHPATFDVYSYAFSNTLGFDTSFALGRIAAPGTVLFGATRLVYAALPLVITLLFVFPPSNPKPIRLFLVMTVAGCGVYAIFPAAGPAYAFRGLFPFDAASADAFPVRPLLLVGAPRNAMPSLHMSAALLIWWNSRHWRSWVHGLAALFAASTAFATLALGEHYLIDLVVAFPFAIAVQASCLAALPLKRTERLRPLLAGGTMVAAWLLLQWTGLPIFAGRPWLSWVCVLLSVVLPVVWERRLASAWAGRNAAGVCAPESTRLLPAGMESLAS